MIRAAIFDLDGVLVDSEPLHLEATNHVLANYGQQLSSDECLSYLGWTDRAYCAALVDRFDLPDTVEFLVEARRRAYLQLLEPRIPIHDGVDAFLHRLTRLALPVGLASSSDANIIERILVATDLKRYFNAITAGDEVTSSKPAPDIFTRTASKLAVPNESCLVFEDSPNGIQAALNARMRCVRVLTSTTSGLHCPPTNAVIDSFVGLDPAALLHLAASNP